MGIDSGRPGTVCRWVTDPKAIAFVAQVKRIQERES